MRVLQRANRSASLLLSLWTALVVVTFSSNCVAQTSSSDLDLQLHGSITPDKLGKHEMLSFTVPEGIERINVELISPGFAKGMYLTAGLFDPQRYRGEGRGTFTVSSADATGPYIVGPIVPGTWKIAIGYNYVAPGSNGEFTVKIRLSKQLDPEHYRVINPKAGWYKGDLHSHTGLTDAMCKSQSGANVPCPPSRLFAAAAAQKMDFLAVTDHNTSATFNEMAQAQLYYDRMLLIVAQEVTTVKGHANVWGTEGFLDYRVAESGFTANDLFDQAHRLHALVSINHAYWPYDGGCPGCGWGWAKTDFAKVDAIEMINGYHEHGSWFTPPAGNGVSFWEAQLAKGFRPTGVGGGDEHRAGEQLALQDGVGIPTTLVYARELSQPAILEGIKAGHVFVQVTGPDGPPLFLTAGSAMMGDAIVAVAGKRVSFGISTQPVSGATVRIFVDGVAVESVPKLKPGAAESIGVYDWLSDGARHWIRAELVDSKGETVTLTNPIYVNWRSQ
jgi:hypothetical protein